MALLQTFKIVFKPRTSPIKLCSTFTDHESKIKKEFKEKSSKKTEITEELLREIRDERNESDMPIEMKNPFTVENPKCILCKYDIEPSYKNVRLLSQFVSTYTGRVYGRHITGLCKHKQSQVEREIKKAQVSGLMGVYVKDLNFFNDPDLYDPSKPFRVL